MISPINSFAYTLSHGADADPISCPVPPLSKSPSFVMRSFSPLLMENRNAPPELVALKSYPDPLNSALKVLIFKYLVLSEARSLTISP